MKKITVLGLLFSSGFVTSVLASFAMIGTASADSDKALTQLSAADTRAPSANHAGAMEAPSATKRLTQELHSALEEEAKLRNQLREQVQKRKVLEQKMLEARARAIQTHNQSKVVGR